MTLCVCVCVCVCVSLVQAINQSLTTDPELWTLVEKINLLKRNRGRDEERRKRGEETVVFFLKKMLLSQLKGYIKS